MRAVIFSFTTKGENLAKRLQQYLSQTFEVSLCHKGEDRHQKIADAFSGHVQALFFIGAVGIAVRLIAPYVQDKLTDPAVVVMDDHGYHVISLLSGHAGGANVLTRDIVNAFRAQGLSSEAVITTATDVRNLPNVEAVFQHYSVPLAPFRTVIKQGNAVLAEGKSIGVYLDPMFSASGIPWVMYRTVDELAASQVDYKIAITPALLPEDKEIKVVVPKVAVLGTGCKKGLDSESYKKSLVEFMTSHHFSIKSIDMIASIDIKKDEQCMKEVASSFGWKQYFLSLKTLLPFEELFEGSSFVKQTVGVSSVAMTAAYCLTKDWEVARRTYRDNGCTFALGFKKEEYHD